MDIHVIFPQADIELPQLYGGSSQLLCHLWFIYHFGLVFNLRLSGFHLTVDTLPLLALHTDTSKQHEQDLHCCFCNLQGTYRVGRPFSWLPPHQTARAILRHTAYQTCFNLKVNMLRVFVHSSFYGRVQSYNNSVRVLLLSVFSFSASSFVCSSCTLYNFQL